MTEPRSPASADAHKDSRLGFLACVAACGIWGVSPVFFKALSEVGAWEVVSHRIVWSTVVLAAIVLATGRYTDALRILRTPKQALTFLAAALCITANWTTFVWAVGNGHALQASMGYYIMPLLTVLLAAVFLRERFTRRQGVALLLVVGGVAALVIGLGTLPWVALVLGLTFALYGLLRKIATAEALTGQFIETLMMLPLALATLAWLEVQGTAIFGHGGRWDLWLLLALGTPVWTALPLFFWAVGARRLRLSTTGLMFYQNPTTQFLIAVFLFQETFTATHAIAFTLIWAGIGLYLWPRRRTPDAAPAPVSAPAPQETGEP